MSQDKYKLSEWRANPIVIKGGEYYEQVFMDTAPNVFYLQNPYDAPIYISIGNIPTVERYEFEIKPKRADVCGRPLPTKRIYILNPSSEEMTVTLYSNYQVFDIGLLKDMYVEIDTSQFKYDGKITGFNAGVSLPVTTLPSKPLEVTGSKLTDIVDSITALKNWVTSKWSDGSFAEKNSPLIIAKLNELTTHIINNWSSGSMVEKNSGTIKTNTDSIKADTSELKSYTFDIKSYTNTIMTNVQSIKLVLSSIFTSVGDIYKHITDHWSDGSFKEKNSGALLTQITTLNNQIKPTLDYGFTYGTLYKTNINEEMSLFCIDGAVIKLITNDGDKDLKLRIKQSSSETLSFILKSGESLTDFPVLGDEIYVTPVNGNISYRLVIINY